MSKFNVVYKTVEHMSVCLSHHLATAAACSGFAAERRVGKIYRSTAAAPRPPAAAVPAVNASSVTLTADVGS